MCMKKHYLGVAICSLLFTLSCSNDSLDVPDSSDQTALRSAANPQGVTLMWNNEKQVIDGFGVAQAGWADRFYAHKKRSEVMGLLFGEEGLHLSILRGEVFPHYAKSEADVNFDVHANIDMPLTDPFFDTMTEDLLRRGQLWITREAKNTYGVDKLVFSTWSPPAYMKSNGQVSKGSLKTAYYQKYADYLVDFYKAYQSVGLKPYAISPANEPEFPAEWNSCVWFPASSTLGKFIAKNMGPAFQGNNVDAKIIFGENAQWSTFALVMGSLLYVKNILKGYPEIANMNAIASGHGYPDPITNKDLAIVPYPAAEDKGLNVWLTEVSTVDDLDPSFTNGLKWAATFHRYLNDANVSAIIWWAGARPTSNNESLIVLDPDRERYTVTKRYDAYGNFTRYIKPGSHRIEVARGSQLPTDFHLTAYKDGGDYVVVTVNLTDKEVVTPVTIDGVTQLKGMKRILTDANNKWAESEVAPDSNNIYTMTVPPKSVVTFIGTVQ